MTQSARPSFILHEMGFLTKYSVFFGLSFVIFVNASSAEEIREFVAPVNVKLAVDFDYPRYKRILRSGYSFAGVRNQVVKLDIVAMKVDHRDEAIDLEYAWRPDEEFYVSPFPDILLTAKTKTVQEAPYDEVWSILATVKDLDGNDGTLVMSVTDNSPYEVHGEIMLGGRIFRIRHVNGPYHVIYELDLPKLLRLGEGNDVIELSPSEIQEILENQ